MHLQSLGTYSLPLFGINGRMGEEELTMNVTYLLLLRGELLESPR